MLTLLGANAPWESPPTDLRLSWFGRRGQPGLGTKTRQSHHLLTPSSLPTLLQLLLAARASLQARAVQCVRKVRWGGVAGGDFPGAPPLLQPSSPGLPHQFLPTPSPPCSRYLVKRSLEGEHMHAWHVGREPMVHGSVLLALPCLRDQPQPHPIPPPLISTTPHTPCGHPTPNTGYQPLQTRREAGGKQQLDDNSKPAATAGARRATAAAAGRVSKPKRAAPKR